jgi:hypothetical protein
MFDQTRSSLPCRQHRSKPAKKENTSPKNDRGRQSNLPYRYLCRLDVGRCTRTTLVSQTLVVARGTTPILPTPRGRQTRLIGGLQHGWLPFCVVLRRRIGRKFTLHSCCYCGRWCCCGCAESSSTGTFVNDNTPTPPAVPLSQHRPRLPRSRSPSSTGCLCPNPNQALLPPCGPDGYRVAPPAKARQECASLLGDSLPLSAVATSTTPMNTTMATSATGMPSKRPLLTTTTMARGSRGQAVDKLSLDYRERAVL